MAGPFVAIAVGNTKDGESLPAKPGCDENESAWLGEEHEEVLRQLTQLGKTRAAI